MKKSISPAAAIGIVAVVVIAVVLVWVKMSATGASEPQGKLLPGYPGGPTGQMPADMARYMQHGPAGPPPAQGAPGAPAPAPGP